MPMPTRGAVYLTNGKRRSRSKSPFARVIARLNSRKNRKNRKNGRKYGRRFNSLAFRANRKYGRRKNSLAFRANGRRHNRKYGRRKNSLAFRANGRRHNRKYGRRHNRRNPAVQLLNGKRRRRYNRRRNTGGVIGTLRRFTSKVPLVGKPVSGSLSGILYGAAGLGLVFMGYKHLGKYIPPQVKGYLAPVGYTAGGLALGVALSKLPIPIAASTKKTLAAAMVLGGAAVDVFRYFTGKSNDLGDEYGLLGDGGAWQLGSIAMGDVDSAGVMGDYMDACGADAMYSGPDLDEEEGQAALAGPRMWRRRFPQTKSATRVQSQCSRHAAKHGHRWGWLCKMIGFQNFQRVVALPAGQRVAYIQQLRHHAIQTIPAQPPLLQAQVPQMVLESGDSQPLGALLMSGT